MSLDLNLYFLSCVDIISNRLKIEQQPEGWAVIIDNEVYSWTDTESSAQDVAIRLSDLGF